MGKYSGIILDHTDDNFATYKMKTSVFTEFKKTAEKPQIKEDLPNSASALIMGDGPDVLKKYACYDADSTGVSILYFLKHGAKKLPEEAIKIAAHNLTVACLDNDILPPTFLTKLSFGIETNSKNFDNTSNIQPVDNFIDITDKKVQPIIKKASSKNIDDYMFVGKNGKRLFPMHTWQGIKQAEKYLLVNEKDLKPSIRRSCAVKLANKAKETGYPLNSKLKLAGSNNYADNEHIKECLDMRTTFTHDKKFVDGLMEKKASLSPELFCKVLEKHDVNQGLTSLWGHSLPDPWESTFGLTKQAEFFWQNETDKVTEDELKNLATNHGKLVCKYFTKDIKDKFFHNPLKTFKSLPEHEKVIMARMASDLYNNNNI